MSQGYPFVILLENHGESQCLEIIWDYMRLYRFFWLMICWGIVLLIQIYWGESQSFKGNPHQATRRDDTGFWRLPSCDCGCVRRPTPVDWWLVRGLMMMHGGVKRVKHQIYRDIGGYNWWTSIVLTAALFLHVWMFVCVFCFGVFCLFSGIDEWWSKKLCTNSDKWIMMSTSSNYNHYTYT